MKKGIQISPEASASSAARLLLTRWRELVRRRTGFAFETTFSGRTYAPMLQAARRHGYTIEMHYLWVPRVSICLRRIGNRVKKGGHKIPETDVRRRYPASIHNFFTLYLRLTNEATLWDVSQKPSKRVAKWLGGKPTIHEEGTYERIKNQTA